MDTNKPAVKLRWHLELAVMGDLTDVGIELTPKDKLVRINILGERCPNIFTSKRFKKHVVSLSQILLGVIKSYLYIVRPWNKCDGIF